ncbi:MAG: response regulator [Chitinophagaceae bacterium]|nr:response regulator [Chitinophagaceae bacterium]
MRAQFLYDYKMEEQNKLMNQIISGLDDLIFILDVDAQKAVFHNGAFEQFSTWESLILSSNMYEAIKTKLYPQDIGGFIKLSRDIRSMKEGDTIICDLHILNMPEVYGLYQFHISLFRTTDQKPELVLCKIKTIKDHVKLKELIGPISIYKKIILVDDDSLTNILNKKIINAILPKADIEVFLDVDDALDYLKLNDKNGDFLVFLDINFPGRNGWDFMDDYSYFPVKSKVIMLSSSIVQKDRNKAMGYKDVLQYVSKPLSFTFLETVL